MDIKKITEKFDHNAGTFPDALGVSNHETLQRAVLHWMVGEDKNSRTVQMILDHATLNDNEKIFCLIEFGKIMLAYNQFSDKMDRTGTQNPMNDIVKMIDKIMMEDFKDKS